MKEAKHEFPHCHDLASGARPQPALAVARACTPAHGRRGRRDLRRARQGSRRGPRHLLHLSARQPERLGRGVRQDDAVAALLRGPRGVLPRQRLEHRRRGPARCGRHCGRRGRPDVQRHDGPLVRRPRHAGLCARRRSLGRDHGASSPQVPRQRDSCLAHARLRGAVPALLGRPRAASRSRRLRLPADRAL